MSANPAPGSISMRLEITTREDRRERILDTVADLGREGDFEAVQMRVVAERADVALGTLYRYFPSKIHLLVSLLVRELERNSALLPRLIQGDTALDRLMHLTDLSIQARQSEPLLHSAMMRAYVFAGPTSGPDNARVSDLSRSILCHTIQLGGRSKPDDVEIAGVLTDVWLSGAVGWVAGRLSHDDVRERMERATRLLLGG